RIGLAFRRLHDLADKEAQQFLALVLIGGAVLLDLLGVGSDDIADYFFQCPGIRDLLQAEFGNHCIGVYLDFYVRREPCEASIYSYLNFVSCCVWYALVPQSFKNQFGLLARDSAVDDPSN